MNQLTLQIRFSDITTPLLVDASKGSKPMRLEFPKINSESMIVIDACEISEPMIVIDVPTMIDERGSFLLESDEIKTNWMKEIALRNDAQTKHAILRLTDAGKAILQDVSKPQVGLCDNGVPIKRISHQIVKHHLEMKNLVLGDDEEKDSDNITPLVEISSSPTSKVLDFLMRHDTIDHSESDIKRRTQLAHQTVSKVLNKLFEYNLVTKRQVGKCNLYGINYDSKPALIFKEFYEKLIHNRVTKSEEGLNMHIDNDNYLKEIKKTLQKQGPLEGILDSLESRILDSLFTWRVGDHSESDIKRRTQLAHQTVVGVLNKLFEYNLVTKRQVGSCNLYGINYDSKPALIFKEFYEKLIHNKMIDEGLIDGKTI